MRREKKRRIIFGISFLCFLFLGNSCVYAEEKEIFSLRINEVRLTGGTGKSNEDFVEIYNFGKESIDLKGWSLRKETSGKKEYSLYSFSSEYILKPGEFFLWANKDNNYADSLGADAKNGNTLTYENRIFLQNKEEDEIDSYFFEKSNQYTSAFDGEKWKWVCNETPKKENNFSGFLGERTLRLEELLPDPESDQNEFVELYNYGEKEINLSGWFVSDAVEKKALSGILAPGEYRADSFGLSLNNTKEKISLIDKCEGSVDTFEYEDSHKGKSWSFDEEKWRETPFVTKGEKNNFPQKIQEPTIRLNEIMPSPSEDQENNEFIEIYNFGKSAVDIGYWSLKDASDTGYVFPRQTIITPNEYKVFYRKDFSFALNDSGKETVYLLDPADFEVDSTLYEETKKDFSFSFDEEKKEWKLTPYTSPHDKNIFPLHQKDVKIRLNEILPDPDGDEAKNEYIELYNFDNKEIDISYWGIQDTSGVEYIFPQGTRIASGEYFSFSRNIFKFSLNNTKEKISLKDATGYEIDFVTYENTKKNISWNRNEKNEWRKSAHLTPGKKNKFNNLPKISEKDIPKKGYVHMKTLFSAHAKDEDGDEIKYRWEFGDGKKSYLENTSHIYEKKGRYEVSLYVNDGIEEVVFSKSLVISKYPEFKAKIVAFVPNPAGRDTDNEWIEIINEDEKTLDLSFWSIATGADAKKLVNHPLRDVVKIEPGKTEKIYRTQSSFSLRNSSGIIELRRPNQTVAHTVSYEKEKINEGDTYQFSSGLWGWISKEKGKEVLSKEESVVEEKEEFVLGSSIERERYFYKGIFILEYEKRRHLLGYEEKKYVDKRGDQFVFTRGGLIKQHSWWTRCLWGACLEG
ncbi:MAG: lamin tail domain-containing protein [Candidatus Moraniibacteriota bacterium]|nr:MAG: lamin tail domain-containing protein [Candidatus Moranbacteria bacterium]